jgi:quinol monooxygenase YgiN
MIVGPKRFPVVPLRRENRPGVRGAGVIVTVVRVTDPGRFLEVFETIGAEKRREHGCRSARVYFDPDDELRAWSVFDWDAEDYEGFLADPEIPAIARALGLQAPPVRAVAATELDA